MKIISIVLVVFLSFTFAVSASTKNVGKEEPIYDYSTNYDGPFAPSQLYTRSENKNNWRSSKRPITVEDLTCTEAFSALKLGTWQGNLSDTGECLGYAEAPEWTSGNYLNFLSEKSRRKAE